MIDDNYIPEWGEERRDFTITDDRDELRWLKREVHRHLMEVARRRAFRRELGHRYMVFLAGAGFLAAMEVIAHVIGMMK